MSLSSWIVLGVVALLVAVASWWLIRQRRAARKGQCASSCGGCVLAASCKKRS